MNVVLDAFYSLGRDLNKTKGGQGGDSTQQGIVSEKMPELTLDMPDDEIIKLTTKWESRWLQSEVKADMDKKSLENENYWKGYHYQRPEVDKTRALIDNVIFEALETFLPAATGEDPEAMVEIKGNPPETTPQQDSFVQFIHEKLAQISDTIRLRLKTKRAVRHWALDLVGVMKGGWDVVHDIPTAKIILPSKVILDPQATIDEDGYTGDPIGEYRKMAAGAIIEIIDGDNAGDGAVQFLKDLVKDDLSTELQFIEWWTNAYTVWTMNKKVLLKKKNPYWNYPTQQKLPDVEALDDEGEPIPPVALPPIPGINHLAAPKKPYFFLSVFNLGKRPIDDTSLIGQNLSNQDIINKRMKQIDKNADSANNGIVVSLEKSGLTTQQAKGVTEALRKGGTVAVPSGSAQEAIYRPQLPELPAMVYNQLQDTRMRVQGIFGTQGLSAQMPEKVETYRGAIQATTLATDRIGGGVGEYIEQMLDDFFNFCVQMLYVLDEETIAQLHNPQFQQGPPALHVSVKPGSLLPKDSVTLANQAIDLTKSGKMALIDLYKALDYPNAEDLAANVWLEANAPELLFGDNPLVQKAVQMKSQQAAQAAQMAVAARQKESEAKVSESIAFKDLPPDGQAQMAAKVGIILHPEGIAAHEEHEKVRETAHEVVKKVVQPPIQPQVGGETNPTP
jgi:hypothetical protein